MESLILIRIIGIIWQCCVPLLLTWLLNAVALLHNDTHLLRNVAKLLPNVAVLLHNNVVVLSDVKYLFHSKCSGASS